MSFKKQFSIPMLAGDPSAVYQNLDWESLPTQLRALLPLDKHDTAQAEALIALGYPAVTQVLPHLTIWLQDMNWPVAQVIAPFLAGIGEPLLPVLRAVLQGDDEIWKYWVLRGVVEKMSDDCVHAMLPVLVELAQRPSEEQVDVLASALVAKLGGLLG